MEELELLRKLIMKELNDMVDALADGIAKDYAEYKEIVGKCRGLHQVKELIDDRMRKIASGQYDEDIPGEVRIETGNNKATSQV